MIRTMVLHPLHPWWPSWLSDRSRADMIWRFSWWLSWWPPWISEETVLAILNIHAVPMPSAQFPLHPSYGSGADNNWRLSRWLIWWIRYWWRCRKCALRKHAYSNILKTLQQKKGNFPIKNSDIFHISARRSGSNEYPQSMFLNRNKKNNVYPCKPQFYYIKVGLKGVKII